ncbi:Isoliquiritigenin 2'-O-methyltransferase [Spatholobus suberectus]|nr:Isoliquiritigenin 2'-O-methyltransferase [Spatholobus suberectus]
MGSIWEQNSPDYATEDNNACISALQHCFGPIYSAVLKTALELNVFEIIAKASPLGVSASDVASQLPTQHPELPRRLDRMLCLLASHSLLTCSIRTNEVGVPERFYQLSLAGKYFVKDDNKGSLAFLSALLSHRVIVDVFLNFKEILLDYDKGLFQKVHGVPIYEGLQSDPALNNVFNEAMANLGIIEMKKLLEIYGGFEEISLLVDVGGGIGHNLNMIITKYPSIKGINFDLPHVIQNAPTYPGIKQLEGDMFESVPKGDAIILKAVLHNWSDEKCLKILSNCYKALPQNGKVIVVDIIVPEAIHSTEADKMVTGFDNLMFLDDGIERTEKEFENLCKRSGFSNFQVAGRAISALGVIELRK